MAITIDDIYDKEFTKRGGGYDPEDVDQFLDEVCCEMEAMQTQIASLQNDLEQTRLELDAARSAANRAPAPAVVKTEPVAQVSSTLEGILLSAQRLADEAVANANTKAEGILKEAQEKADQLVENALNEKDDLTGQLETLRSSVKECKAGLLSMLDKYRAMVEED